MIRLSLVSSVDFPYIMKLDSNVLVTCMSRQHYNTFMDIKTTLYKHDKVRITADFTYCDNLVRTARHEIAPLTL